MAAEAWKGRIITLNSGWVMISPWALVRFTQFIKVAHRYSVQKGPELNWHKVQHRRQGLQRRKQLALVLQIKCITIYASMVTRAGHKYLPISSKMELCRMMNWGKRSRSSVMRKNTWSAWRKHFGPAETGKISHSRSDSKFRQQARGQRWALRQAQDEIEFKSIGLRNPQLKMLMMLRTR